MGEQTESKTGGFQFQIFPFFLGGGNDRNSSSFLKHIETNTTWLRVRNSENK